MNITPTENITNWVLTNWHTIHPENQLNKLADELIKGKYPKDLKVSLQYELNGDCIDEPVGEIINVMYDKTNHKVFVQLLLHKDKMEMYNLNTSLINSYSKPVKLPVNVTVFSDISEQMA